MLMGEHQVKLLLYAFKLHDMWELMWTSDRLLIGYQDTALRGVDFNQADISESMKN